METKKFDYNLICYLVTIVETRSMASAAQLLDVAPSAVSYAVKKMRDHYHDPLFVRSLNGVVPTTLAMNLYAKFKAINTEISNALIPDILGHAQQRSIYIRCNPLIELAVTEILLKTRIVPDMCKVEFRYINLQGEHRTSKLRNKEVDIDIGLALQSDSSIVSRQICDLDFRLLCREGHKTIGERITLEQFSKEKYVAFNSQFYSSLLRADVGDVLSLRETDPVVISDSSINSAFSILFQDLLFICPSIVADILKNILPVREVDCDFLKKGNVKYFSHIHKSTRGDILIEKILDTIRENFSPT